MEYPTPIVYIGIDSNKKHRYLSFTTIEENDGRSITSISTQKNFFESKLFKDDCVGAIHFVKNDTVTVYFQKNTRMSGFWKNSADRSKWQIENKSAESIIKMTRDAKKMEYEDMLNPIREAYYNARTYKEKNMILAEVIRVVTGR